MPKTLRANRHGLPRRPACLRWLRVGELCSVAVMCCPSLSIWLTNLRRGLAEWASKYTRAVVRVNFLRQGPTTDWRSTAGSASGSRWPMILEAAVDRLEENGSD
jgi:hypothetical protein